MEFDEIFTKEDILKVLPTLRESESETQFDINKGGFVGSYQMSTDALIDSGYINPKYARQGNKILRNPDAWLIEGGLDAFLADENLQKDAAYKYMKANYKFLKNKGKIKEGMSKSAIMGLTFEAHIVGAGGAGNNAADANGTKGSTYNTMGQMAFNGDGRVIRRSGNKLAVHKPADLSADYVQMVDERERPTPTNMQVQGANITQNANIFSTYEAFKNKRATRAAASNPLEVDTNFNPFEGVDAKKYNDILPQLGEVDNEEQKQILINSYDQELKDRQVLRDASGWQTLATIPVAIAGDATTYIPLVGQLGAVVKGTLKAGGVLVNAVKGAALGATFIAADETILHSTQNARTLDESVDAVGFGALLGGAGGSLLGKSNVDRAASEVRYAESINEVKHVDDATVKSIGAAENTQTLRAKLKEAGNNLDKSNPKFRAFVASLHSDTLPIDLRTPILRLLDSPMPEVATAATKLFRTALQTEANAKGIASDIPVSGKVWLAQEAYAYKMTQIVSNYTQENKLLKTGKKRADFDEELSDHLGRDTTPKSKSMKEAVDFFKDTWEHYKQEYIKAGVFKEGVEIPKGYNMVAYNFEAIHNRPLDFRAAIEKHVRPAIVKDLKYTMDEYRTNVTIKGEVDTYIEEEVNKIIRHVKNDSRVGNVSNVYFRANSKSVNTKERLLNLPYDDAKPFLNPSMDDRMSAYIRRAETDLNVREAFNVENIDEVITELKNIAADKAGRFKTNAESATYMQEVQDNIETISGVYERIIGTRGRSKNKALEEVTNTLLAWNYTRLLGSTTLTMLNEGGKVATYTAFKQFHPEITAIGNTIKQLKIDKKTIKSYGIGGDFDKLNNKIRMNDSSNAYLAEVMQKADPADISKASKWKKFREGVVNKFSLISGIPIMDDFLRRLSFNNVVGYYSPKIQRLADGDFHLPDGSINPKHKKVVTDLARFGYDRNKAQSFTKMIREKGTNPDNWGKEGDEFLQRTALEIDNIIIRPNEADKYMWTDANAIGRLANQFRSFQQGSFSKFLAAGLQRDDALFWSQYASLIATTYAVNEIKDIAFNRKELDFKSKFMRAVDSSGTVPIIGDIGFLGANIIGASNTRTRQPNVMQLFGPSLSLAESFAKVLQPAVTDAKWTDNTTNQLKQIIPFNNVLPIQIPYEQTRDKK